MLDEVKPVTMMQIEAARARLEGLSLVSPLVPCDAAPAGKTVRLKLENLQPIGAFKLRGAYNKIASLSPEERKRGVIAYSSGNHAQGVAYAARALQTKEMKLQKRISTRRRGCTGPAAREWAAKDLHTGSVRQMFFRAMVFLGPEAS